MERGWRRGPGSVYRAGTGPGQGRGAAAVPPGGPRARPRVAEPRPGGPVWLPARVGNSSVYGGPVPAGLAAGRALGAFRDAGCHLAPSGISRPVGGAPRGAADPTGGLTGTSNSFLPVTELYLEGVPPLPSAFDANCEVTLHSGS
nr:cdc42 effector protein 1-like isoform X1 [Anser cygnoides]